MWTHSQTPLNKGGGKGHLGNLPYTLNQRDFLRPHGERPLCMARTLGKEGGQGVVSPTHEIGNRLTDDCAKDERAHEIGQEGEGHASHSQQEVADCQ